MSKVRIQTTADYFEELDSLGVRTRSQIRLFQNWKGGLWLNDEGEKQFLKPDPSAGLELKQLLTCNKLRAAAAAAGFDEDTIQDLVDGKITAEEIGLEAQ